MSDVKLPHNPLQLPVAPSASQPKPMGKVGGAQTRPTKEAKSGSSTQVTDGHEDAKPHAPTAKANPQAALARPTGARLGAQTGSMRRMGTLPNGDAPLVDGDARTAPLPDAEHIAGTYDKADLHIQGKAQNVLNQLFKNLDY